MFVTVLVWMMAGGILALAVYAIIDAVRRMKNDVDEVEFFEELLDVVGRAGMCTEKVWSLGAIWGCSHLEGHEGDHKFGEVLADYQIDV